jgi:phosphoglucosamine mutase
LTARFATDLATAAAAVLSAHSEPRSGRPVAVVGRDPRASGQFLEAAVVAGLAGAGVDVLRLGVVPTPAVAYLTGVLDAEFGVMLSASHNPAPDNGIKFFSHGGLKLADQIEDEIERVLTAQRDTVAGVPAAGFGRVHEAAPEVERYLDHLLSSLPDTGGRAPLAGLRVVVDCAHGAAFELAPRLLSRAGADVITIGADPDGDNINSGYGSTSLEAVSAAVREHGADAGLAFDGDADRCLAVDGTGEVIDGDQILAMLAFALREEGRLRGNTVVATVMSNLGLRLALREAGISMIETPVGDRYVLGEMLAGGFALGGEQSGHIILLDHSTTGDGLLTGLQLLAVAAGRGQPLGELAKVMTRYPQVLISVPGVDKSLIASSAGLNGAVAAAKAELGSSGRVLVRPSGTENTVRIMVESADAGQARRLADKLGEAVREVGQA